MTEFSAAYFDGKTSSRIEVRVLGTGDGLRVLGENIDLTIPLEDARVDAPISGTRRAINLPGGAQLQTDDHAALEVLFPRANSLEGWVHRLEHHWRYALAALLAIVVASAWTVTYGLPFAAKVAAGFVPPELEARLGEQTLASIDSGFCTPSKLNVSRQDALRGRFQVLTTGLEDGYRYQLEIRSCQRLGANAFALPGGAIVLTDRLVELAENDAQVSAVLAHEIGHVRHRHGLRQALQAAGLAALITALSGDAVSITSLAATLPTMLLQSGYSREFEEESDSYAFQRLKEVGLSPRYFAEIITRLDRVRSDEAEAHGTARGERTFDYLSTHPATARRVERALASQ